MKTYKVLVYGTLKKGYGLHALLEDQKYLGVRDVQGMEVYCCGWFPYACFAPGVKVYPDTRKFIPNPDSDKRLIGELYEVDLPTLYAMDQAEGEGRHYSRVQVEICGEWVHVYIVDRKYASQYNFCADGWWTAHGGYEYMSDYSLDVGTIESITDYYLRKLENIVMPDNREEMRDIVYDLIDDLGVYECQ